jgi:hypothetical protein
MEIPSGLFWAIQTCQVLKTWQVFSESTSNPQAGNNSHYFGLNWHIKIAINPKYLLPCNLKN